MTDLPCDACGGPGWFFAGGYGLVACADCNDDERTKRPRPGPDRVFPSRLPEPWTEDQRVAWHYHCGQCNEDAHLKRWISAGLWWTCCCLAVAETATGTAVLMFPQPLPMGMPGRIG